MKLIAILLLALSFSTNAETVRITDVQGRTKAYVVNNVVRHPTGQAIVRIDNNGSVRNVQGQKIARIR